MLTGRGWWFLIAAAALALTGVAGVGYYSAAVPLLGLALLGGFLGDWLLFAARWRRAASQLRVERILTQSGRPVTSAWAGGIITVRLRVMLDGGAILPIVHLIDRPAGRPRLVSGTLETWATLGPERFAEWGYAVRPAVAGVLRFEGVVVRVADPAGFFARRLMLREAAEYLVLPPLTDDEGKAKGVKPFNALPAPGAHRLRRAGSGSELLDLRDYRPGDAPKMVAWRASARRDRLIVKEFESDVPVRCVLFLDAAPSLRVGPDDRTPLARLAGVAAGAAQAAAGARDLVGLTVFDTVRAEAIPPDRSRPHLIRLLRALAQAAGRPTPATAGDAEALQVPALALAEELYPDLLTSDINSRPWGLFWRPIADSNWFLLLLALIATPILWGKRQVIEALAAFAVAVAPAGKGWMLLLFLIVLPGVSALLLWAGYGLAGFWPPRARSRGRRKSLAALYAWLDDAGPAAVERYLADDDLFARRSLRFLADHRAAPPAAGRAPGEVEEEARRKAEVLARTLIQAVARARDNELYVILADLAPAAGSLAPLLAALRTARGRHHQAVVIAPWPADVPPETASEAPARRDGLLRLGAVVRAGLVQQQLRRHAELRLALTKIGVPLLRLEDSDAVRQILDRLDRLRGVRVRR